MSLATLLAIGVVSDLYGRLIIATVLTEVLIPVLVVIIGGGGLLGLYTIRPQRDSIIAAASKSAVEAVQTSMEAMAKELSDSRIRIIYLEKELNLSLRDRDVLREELSLVRRRVAELEHLLGRSSVEPNPRDTDIDAERTRRDEEVQRRDAKDAEDEA